MQGLVFTADRTAELREVPVAEPGPGQVLLGIRASGICGSDLHTYHATVAALERGSYTGVVAGHEPAGVVESVGAGVAGLRRGDRVLAYHIVGCGSCRACRAGQMVNCTSPERDAYGARRHGSHAPFMLAEARTLIPIPDGATFVDGAMTACGLATAYAALRKAGTSGRDTVLVTGLGPVGLGAVLVAAALGAEVIGVDPNADRARLALELGASATFDGGPDTLERVREHTRGDGASVTLDCTGVDTARLLCLAAAGTWGHAVFVGFGQSDLRIDAGRLVITKQLTLHGSWVASTAEMEETVRFLARRDVHGDRLVTHRYPIDRGGDAYREFDAGGAGKYVFVW